LNHGANYQQNTGDFHKIRLWKVDKALDARPSSAPVRFVNGLAFPLSAGITKAFGDSSFGGLRVKAFRALRSPRPPLPGDQPDDAPLDPARALSRELAPDRGYISATNSSPKAPRRRFGIRRCHDPLCSPDAASAFLALSPQTEPDHRL
jgi:hypothetical protein